MDVQSRREESRLVGVRQILVRLMIATCVLVAVVVLGISAAVGLVDRYVRPEESTGATCSILDHESCTDLSAVNIEAATGLAFPAGTRVLSSRSGVGFPTPDWTLTAELSVPAGAPLLQPAPDGPVTVIYGSKSAGRRLVQIVMDVPYGEPHPEE